VKGHYKKPGRDITRNLEEAITRKPRGKALPENLNLFSRRELPALYF